MNRLSALAQRGRLPLLFASGLMIVAGAGLHIKAVFQAPHYRLAGMPGQMGQMSSWQSMTTWNSMTFGMILLFLGSLLAIWTVIVPGFANTITKNNRVVDNPGGELGKQHYLLATILVATLAIDTMKPFTLAFVLPGLRDEYGIGKAQASELPLVALIGTVLGSLIWGRLGDRVGRRTLIVFSALIFTATSACGGMPTFNLNLLMCFIMGAAAGGLLPVGMTLVSELIPELRRGQVALLVGAAGGLFGYLAAAGAAALIEPHFGWRFLWFIGLPTGLLLVVFAHVLPESPHFLLAHGRDQEASEAVSRYGGTVRESKITKEHSRRLRLLLATRYRARTVLLVSVAFFWGIANFGFLIWLPTELKQTSVGAHGNNLLAVASMLAVPGLIMASWLHGRVGNKKLFAWTTASTSLAALLLAWWAFNRQGDHLLLVAAMALMVLGMNVLSGTLLPYTGELYPTTLRSTACGMVAGGMKIGGVIGPPLVVLIISASPGAWLPCLFVAGVLVVAGVLIMTFGIETRGRVLEGEREMLGTALALSQA